MKVAVLFESSGIVRDAFIRHGHSAISFDLLPSESSRGPHIQGDLTEYDFTDYELVISHPPCTHLSVSGARWFKYKSLEQEQSLALIRWLMDMKVKRWAIENPISVISSKIRPPDQIVQPWQFGHGEVKATCFWLKELPLLKPTKIVDGRVDRIARMTPSKISWVRGRERARTYPGIAEAMAEQWGNVRYHTGYRF